MFFNVFNIKVKTCFFLLFYSQVNVFNIYALQQVVWINPPLHQVTLISGHFRDYRAMSATDTTAPWRVLRRLP